MLLGQKVKWSQEEIKIVTEAFHDFITSPDDILPGKTLCSDLIEKNPVLQSRTWQKIKDYVRNYRDKLRKLQQGNIEGADENEKEKKKKKKKEKKKKN